MKFISRLLTLCTLPLPATSFFAGPNSRAFAAASIRIKPEAEPALRPHRKFPRQRTSTLGSDVADGEETIPVDEKMRILGVCGGIGSGKSTACQLMVDSLGCVARVGESNRRLVVVSVSVYRGFLIDHRGFVNICSLDADKLAHAVYDSGSRALEKISQEFGKDILDDSQQIDRKKLGAIVFNDAKSMSKLERIVWPHVREKIEERIKEITDEHEQSISAAKKKIIIVEAALLLETDWHDLLDGLWVIQSSQSVATQRLVDSRGLTREEALVRIRAQEKRRGIGRIGHESCKEIEDGAISALITNDGTLGELESSLEKALCDPASFKS